MFDGGDPQTRCEICHEVYDGKCRHPAMQQMAALNMIVAEGLVPPDWRYATYKQYGSGWVTGGACEPKEGPR